MGFGICDDDFELLFESMFLFVFSSVMEVGSPVYIESLGMMTERSRKIAPIESTQSFRRCIGQALLSGIVLIGTMGFRLDLDFWARCGWKTMISLIRSQHDCKRKLHVHDA
jgi:hypothetical protein